MNETKEEYLKLTKARIIYRRVNAEIDWNKQSKFIPSWDSTDHFNFVCADCKTPADIITADFTPKMKGRPNTKLSCLLFILKCPKCGTVGIRRIYLEYPHAEVAWQTAYDAQTNRIYTINGTQPVAYSQIIAENPVKILQQPKLKTVNLEIDLETLCLLWDNRENSDDLDTAIEKLITAGLQAEGKMQ
jgi:hypothetical protein